MRRAILDALRARYEAEIAEADATANIYLDNSVGIGEHPQHIDEVNKLIDKIAQAKEKLEVLDEFEPEKRRCVIMDFIDKIRKIIKMRHDDVVVAMTSGGVDNMEKYQYMLGQIRTYQYLLQEISTLLKTKEQNDSEGTVISIKSKDNNTK